MRTRITRGVAAAVTLAATAVAVVVGLAGTSGAQPAGLRAYALNGDGTLMATFTTDNPRTLDWVRLVDGLNADTALIGIDFRVQDGLLYGVGDQGGIYTIEIPSVVVTQVSQLTVPLHGTSFGVDFNPAADRLRVISNTGQNLRHNLNDDTTVQDTILTVPPMTGAATGVTAAAYTNNDLASATGTTLFDINTATDQVVIQSPANNGLLAPTGTLGVNAGPNAGFDIYSDLTNGTTTSLSGFAVLVTGTSTSMLYNVNLLTGATTGVGQFPLTLADIAIALDTT